MAFCNAGMLRTEAVVIVAAVAANAESVSVAAELTLGNECTGAVWPAL